MIVRPMLAGFGTHASVPLVKGDLPTADGDRIGNFHPMFRLFIDCLRGSHHEFASWQDHHFRTVWTIPKHLSWLRSCRRRLAYSGGGPSYCCSAQAKEQ